MRQMVKLSAVKLVDEYLFICTNKQYNKHLARARKSGVHYKKYYPDTSFKIEEWENKTIAEVTYSKGFTSYEKNGITEQYTIQHYAIK